MSVGLFPLYLAEIVPDRCAFQLCCVTEPDWSGASFPDSSQSCSLLTGDILLAVQSSCVQNGADPAHSLHFCDWSSALEWKTDVLNNESAGSLGAEVTVLSD